MEEDYCTRIFGQKAMFSRGKWIYSIIIVLDREFIDGLDGLTAFSAIACSLCIVANGRILFVAGPLIFNARSLSLSQRNQLRIQPVQTTSGT